MYISRQFLNHICIKHCDANDPFLLDKNCDGNESIDNYISIVLRTHIKPIII